MKRIYLLILFILFLMPMDSNSALLTDIDSIDAMSYGVTIYDPTPPIDPNDPYSILNIIEESVGDNQLVPYASQGGQYGIVNQTGGFFDLMVEFTQAEIISADSVVFSFYVENLSGFQWSDYHFEFYEDGDATAPLSLPILYVENDLSFDQMNFESNRIDFWSYETQGVAPEDFVGLTIEIDMSSETYSYPNEFLIRQIATTAVPIPGAFVLLLSSLVCLAGLRRKQNR